MSGSGSSIFAVFPTELDREEAHARLPQLTLVPVRCLSRACYKAALQMD
jgi:4-diphosphocytidyl-2C-methyl-D-erythritol kinase